MIKKRESHAGPFFRVLYITCKAEWQAYGLAY
jgi:hypothetical protein